MRKKKSVCGIADKAMALLNLINLVESFCSKFHSTGLLSPSADLNDISNVMGVCMLCVHGHVQTNVCLSVWDSSVLSTGCRLQTMTTLQRPHCELPF